jgi:predicted RNA binding protein YcfA (HicA-like mRNA interferase family)
VVKGYYLALVKELQALVFRYMVNAKGSHEKWVRGDAETLIVPRHLYSRHVANLLLKMAGSAKRF